MCDRAVIIARGKIVAQGTPDELRQSAARCRPASWSSARARPTEVEVHARPRPRRQSKCPDSRSGPTTASYTTAALRPADGRDVREEVARTVIQHGWPLREIRLEAATLEEFFVQVTAAQATVAEDVKREDVKT